MQFMWVLVVSPSYTCFASVVIFGLSSLFYHFVHIFSNKMSHCTSIITWRFHDAYEVLLLLESITTSTSRKSFYYSMDGLSFYLALFEITALLFRFKKNIRHSIPRALFAAEYFLAHAHISSSRVFREVSSILLLYTYALSSIIYAFPG